MSNVNDAICALWWWRFMHLHVSLFTTEEAAVLYAIQMVENESGSPQGIQFKDGRIFARQEWPLYLRFVEGEEVSRVVGEPNPRIVKSPFDNKESSYPWSYPDWVGVNENFQS